MRTTVRQTLINGLHLSAVYNLSHLRRINIKVDAEYLKELKVMKDQINDLIRRVETMLLDKHQDNSDAIDDITISLLGGDK